MLGILWCLKIFCRQGPNGHKRLFSVISEKWFPIFRLVSFASSIVPFLLLEFWIIEIWFDGNFNKIWNRLNLFVNFTVISRNLLKIWNRLTFCCEFCRNFTKKKTFKSWNVEKGHFIRFQTQFKKTLTHHFLYFQVEWFNFNINGGLNTCFRLTNVIHQTLKQWLP